MMKISRLLVYIACLASLGCSSSQDYRVPPDPDRRWLQAILETGLTESGYTGAVIQITAPGWTWSSAAGRARRNPEEAAEPAMHFRIASVSKTFTAAAIGKLADDRRLALDDPIENWIPPEYLAKIPRYRDITLRLLLNYRSGIPDYTEIDLIRQQLLQPETPISLDTGILMGLNEREEAWRIPDAGWMYSNVNFLLLTLVIDAASGMPYEEYIRKAIIEPTGLKNTFMMTRPPMKTMPAPSMACLSAQVTGTWDDYSELYVNWDRGAGDVVATVHDLNLFHRALRNGGIVSPERLAEMEKPFSTIRVNLLPSVTDAVNQYGLGYYLVRSGRLNLTLLGHEGGYPGSTTYLLYWKEKNTYISLNLNGDGKDEAKYILLPLIWYLGGQ
jgi:D-alanyl-D-alanine carboxypeptidase